MGAQASGNAARTANVPVEVRASYLILVIGVLAGCKQDPIAPPARPLVSNTAPASSPSATPEPTASSTVGAAAPQPVLAAPALVAGALYAPLFEKNRAWSFREHWERSRYEGADAAHGERIREKGTRDLVCRVEDVEDEGKYVRSFVTCVGQGPAEDEEADHPVASQWVGSARGLFRMGAEICDEPDTHTELRVMERDPKASKKTSRDRDITRTSTLAHEGEAWCWTEEHGGGDPSWRSLCFEGARGFVRGTYGWTGGTTHATTFELVSGARRAP